jgi:hypothetical protein
MGFLIEQERLIVAGCARRDAGILEQLAQPFFLAVGQGFQHRLGLGLHVQDAFDRREGERSIAQRPLQGSRQIVVMVVGPQRQDLPALRFAVPLSLEQARQEQAEDVAIPVETPAGEVAQVDFGYAGKLYDAKEGRFRRAWVFVMVLGFSRHMFARIVFDQKTTTWLALHVEAFDELGGVPRVLVPDNLKAAVIRAAFGADGPSALNRSYRELARHYGFKVDPTPPRAPK